MRKVLVGTVGYHNLRDFSIGPQLLPQLQAMDWPAGVEVDELNWGPIAIVFNFQDMEIPYDRVVILAAIPDGREAGTITLRRWAGGLPSAEKIQDRVAEAVTGVTSLDNLLIIGEHFAIWPDEVIIVDVEPGPEEAGETFTPAVEAIIPDVLAIIRRVALEELELFLPMAEIKGDQLESM